jgi:hypothetical protein
VPQELPVEKTESSPPDESGPSRRVRIGGDTDTVQTQPSQVDKGKGKEVRTPHPGSRTQDSAESGPSSDNNGPKKPEKVLNSLGGAVLGAFGVDKEQKRSTKRPQKPITSKELLGPKTGIRRPPPPGPSSTPSSSSNSTSSSFTSSEESAAPVEGLSTYQSFVKLLRMMYGETVLALDTRKGTAEINLAYFQRVQLDVLRQELIEYVLDFKYRGTDTDENTRSVVRGILDSRKLMHNYGKYGYFLRTLHSL